MGSWRSWPVFWLPQYPDPQTIVERITTIRILQLSLIPCLLSLVGLTNQVVGQTYNQTVLRGQPIVLFGGNSLIGWGKANGKAATGWVVEDGALFRSTRGGDLYHENSVRDFELYFQWKISPGGNSGLKYRVKKYGNQWLGCEYQILDDLSAREANKSGALYALYPPTENKPPAGPDVWHQGKIVVCGHNIQHWLNGQLIVRATVGSEDWKERVQKSKFRGNDSFGENREGRIFLQDHGNPVWFRHIVLVPLYCDSQPALATCGPVTFDSGCCNPCCIHRTTHMRGPLARTVRRRIFNRR